MIEATLFTTFFYYVFLFFFGYFVIVVSYYFILAIIGMLEGRRRKWEKREENNSILYLSDFAIPISIVIPARDEEEWIRDSVLSAINLNYPNFEIIVVDDGSRDNTLSILDETLELRPIDSQYIKHYKDGQVKTVFKSQKHPNVTVISKQPGLKKAGAVNAGLNIAKNDYICIIDADTILEQDALLNVMVHVIREPDKIIGIGSYFGLVNGLEVHDGRIIKYSFSYNSTIAYQNIEYLRSFLGSRIAWSRYNAIPVVAGGFAIWRRDVLYELGGYSSEFTCEDLEFTFRAHDYIAKNRGKGYKILMLPYYVGWTEGPSNVPSLISQRERWQRVTNEGLWRYKYMILNPKYGGFAFWTLPYIILYEVLGIYFEIASIAFVAWGWFIGLLDVKMFIAFFIFIVLSQAFVSLIAILSFVRNQRIFTIRYLLYLIFLSLIEFFAYRWIVGLGKILGTYNFFKGVTIHNQYKREKRIVK